MTWPIRKACCHWIIGTVTDQCLLRHGASPGHDVTLHNIDDNVVMLGVVHNCQHLPISTQSTNLGEGGGLRRASVLCFKC